MKISQASSNNIQYQQAFGYKYPKAKRVTDLANLGARIADLPDCDAELGSVIRVSPSYRNLYKRCKAKPFEVRDFLMEQILRLFAERRKFSHIGFSRKIGNLTNSVCATECAINNRARGEKIGMPLRHSLRPRQTSMQGKRTKKPSVPCPYHAGNPSDRPIVTKPALSPRNIKILSFSTPK